MVPVNWALFPNPPPPQFWRPLLNPPPTASENPTCLVGLAWHASAENLQKLDCSQNPPVTRGTRCGGRLGTVRVLQRLQAPMGAHVGAATPAWPGPWPTGRRPLAREHREAARCGRHAQPTPHTAFVGEHLGLVVVDALHLQQRAGPAVVVHAAGLPQHETLGALLLHFLQFGLPDGRGAAMRWARDGSTPCAPWAVARGPGLALEEGGGGGL